jgi:hypothetical protein
MNQQQDKIRKRVEDTKAGFTGKLARGYKKMNEYWSEHLDNNAARELGAGRPWHFGAHTKELQRWHDQERDRGHSTDKKDLQHEWEDRLDMSIELLKKSKENWAPDMILEARLQTLQTGSPQERRRKL